jgi:hypothetical protein
VSTKNKTFILNEMLRITNEAEMLLKSKSLMENLQSVIKSGNLVKDAEIVPPNDDLINPRTKFGSGSGDLSLGGDEDIDFEIEDDIFE